MYRLPSVSATYSATQSSARSSRSERTSSSLSKYTSMRSSSRARAPTRASSSYQFFQPASLRMIASGRSRTGTERESWMRLSHALSGSQAYGLGFSELASSAPPPVSSIFSCAAESLPASFWMRIASMSTPIVLCRSKRPRCR